MDVIRLDSMFEAAGTISRTANKMQIIVSYTMKLHLASMSQDFSHIILELGDV